MAPCPRPQVEPLLHSMIEGLFSERLMPSGSVLDAGANDGEMAAFYACLDSSRVVHALEPSLSLYHALSRTAGRVRNIAPLRAGVSSTDQALYHSSRATRTLTLPSAQRYS